MSHPHDEDDLSPAAKEIFADALDLSAAELAPLLDARCAGDAGLRRQVESLLAAGRRAGQFMSDPTAAQLPRREDPATPRMIGRYKLLQPIGEGGFGTVYMAEQEHPIRRRVAVKIIKLGMDTKQVIARFEAERQALAMMDHPNIAKVLDAGQTDAGRPYFVMELVNGVPITQYCDSNKLDTRQRLELFIPVCQAVQHAHQKGIIHRDIKPSNVLVTMHDGVPVPKVIDFGIAKATQSKLTERTLFTEFKHFIGTPEYMSPEQAEMSGLDIDTRSDIYSLGVLLYELLTGTTPFEGQDLRSKAYAEMQRIIREYEPPRPSTRLATLGERLDTVAGKRSIDGRRLNGLVRGELDWIVMRCLEKDRTRRYETANGLALDVRRHLDHEPVTARAATAGYRLRKWAMRHKAAAAVAAAILLTLVLGIAGTSAGLLRARANLQRAEAAERRVGDQLVLTEGALAEASAARARAELDAKRATAAIGFIRDMFAAAQPGARPAAAGGPASRPAASEVRVVDVLNQAGQALGNLSGQPELELDGRLTLASTYEALGQFFPAREHYERALALSRKVTGENSEQTIQITSDLLFAMTNAHIAFTAEPMARANAAAAVRALGWRNSATYDAHNSLGLVLRDTGQYAAAETVLRDLTRRIAEDPNLRHPKGTARYFQNLSLVLRDLQRNADALPVEAEALRRVRAESTGQPLRSLRIRQSQAVNLFNDGRLDEAAAAFAETIAFVRDTLGENHAANQTLLILFAQVQSRLGRFADAADSYARVASLLADGDRTTNFYWIFLLCQAENEFRAGRPMEGDRRFTEAFDAAERTPRFDGSDPSAWWIAWQGLAGASFDRTWASPALRELSTDAHILAADAFRDAFPRRKLDPSGFRFTLQRWAREGAFEDLPVAGDLAALTTMADPQPGAYLFDARIPRPGASEARRPNWVLFAPWDVALHRFEGGIPPADDAAWRKLFDSPPTERRREQALLYQMMGNGTVGPGPGRQPNGFALRATTRLRLPPGRYWLNLRYVTQIRAWVNGRLLYDAWQKRLESEPSFVVDDREVEFVVECNFVQPLVFSLFPEHPAAHTAYNQATGGWPYESARLLESVDGRIARTKGSPTADLLWERADLLLRAGRFRDALDAADASIKVDASDHFRQYTRICLLAYLEDAPAHRSAARAMAERFGDPPPFPADRLVKPAIALPGGLEPEELQRFRRMMSDIMRPGAQYLEWFHIAAAMVEYRLGNYADALFHLDAAAPGVKHHGHATATVGYIRAITLFKRGDPDGARAALAEAERTFASADPKPGQRDLGVGGIENYLLCHVARREAKATVKE